MHRADTQHSLQAFHDRLACAQLADTALGEAYLAALRAYVDGLADSFEDIDPWSIAEYERVCEYLHNNREWIRDAAAAADILAAAHDVFAAHRRFLLGNGASAASLVREPSPSFRNRTSAPPEFLP
jgi:hypothetical protein